ncbi:MAG TPA: response regulator transcription factor, partial [Thermomicrobiales bacterium]
MRCEDVGRGKRRGAFSRLAMSADIRVLLVDDHAVLRLGLRALIETEPGILVVGEARNGAEAVDRARALRPDVVLLDLAMPGTDGLYALERFALFETPIQTLVFTSFDDDE